MTKSGGRGGSFSGPGVQKQEHLNVTGVLELAGGADTPTFQSLGYDMATNVNDYKKLGQDVFLKSNKILPQQPSVYSELNIEDGSGNTIMESRQRPGTGVTHLRRDSDNTTVPKGEPAKEEYK